MISFTFAPKHCTSARWWCRRGRSSWCGQTGRGVGRYARRYGRRSNHAGLQQVGRQPLAAIAVEIGQRRAETRSGDAELRRLHDDTAPAGLAAADGFLEELVEKEIDEVGVA